MRLGTLLVLFLVIQISVGCQRRPPRRRYRPPVNRPPSITCPSGGTFNAKYFKTYRTITYGSPSVSDDRGGYSVTRVRGKSSGSNFYEGYNSVTYKVTDSGGLTDYCTFIIKIKVVTCSKLGTPYHGNKRCDNYRNIYGTDCYFSCESGFELSGHNKSSCESNGYYTHSTPSCNRVRCPALSLPSNGLRFRCTNGNYYNSVCSLECDSNRGYTATPGSYTRCQSYKMWSVTYFRCEDTERPSFTNCPHATIKSYSQVVTWPSLQVQDNSGYASIRLSTGQPSNSSFSVGEHLIRYDVEDRASNKGDPCVFTVTVEEHLCQHPSTTFKEDPDLDFMNCNINETEFKEKAVCQTRCKSGTMVHGARFVTCERTSNTSLVPTANWVPKYSENPYCPVRTCDSLPPPKNGAVVCETFLSGTFCQIHCNEWFDIPEDYEGEEGYVCGVQTKTWYPTDQPQDCKETEYGDDYRLPGELYYFVGDCQDKKIADEIKEHFISALKMSSTYSYICADSECKIDNVNITCGKEDVEWYERRRRRSAVLSEKSLLVGPAVGINLRREKRSIEYSTGSQGLALNRNITPTTAPETEAPWFSGNDSLRLPGDHSSNASEVLSVYGNVSTNSTPNGEYGFTIKDDGLILSFNFTTKANNISAKRKEELFNSMMQETVIRLQEASDDFILYNSKLFNISVQCHPGFVHGKTYRDRCDFKACGAGSFHNKSLDSCVPCPKNTYQQNDGQTSCLTCPPLTATVGNGTKSRDGCIDLCKPHHYSPTGYLPCSVCPPGSYQQGYGSKVCVTCPIGTTTNDTTNRRSCISYDVLVEGSTTLKLGSVIPEWENKLTLAFWLKLSTNDGSSPLVSLSFVHPQRGHQMTLNLSDMAKITMIDEELPVKITLLKDRWFSFALVWSGYPRLLQLFQQGNILATYVNPTPLCYLPAGTELNIEVAKQSVLYFRQLSITQDVKTGNEISSFGQSCFTKTYGGVVDLTSMNISQPQNVHLVMPSTCYESDPCTSNPCNGHVCVSDKGRPKCLCHSGYRGVHCAQPPDFCKNHSCQNAAICVSLSTGFTCSCPTGVKGRMCEIIIVNGNWSEWNSWSQCSQTCGGGITSRQRTCDNPAPDSDGKPCPGSAKQERRCNTQKCPECLASQLKSGNGISFQCNATRGVSLNCSISCARGLMFIEAPSHYICNEEVWVPSNFTIGCTEPKLPERVGFNYTINYNTLISQFIRNDTGRIMRKVSKGAKKIKCSRMQMCDSDVEVVVCRNTSSSENGCKAGQIGYRVTITFTSILNTSLLLTIETIESFENVTDVLVNKTVAVFNETQLELKERNAELFTVRLNKRNVTPNESVSQAVINCPYGAVPEDVFCVNCVPGTFQLKGACVRCDAGFYQNATGQTKCDACPGAHYTEYVGSTGLEDCVTPPADMEMLLTDPLNRSVWRINMSSFDVQRLALPAGSLVSASIYNPVSRSIIYADRNTPAIHVNTDDMKSPRTPVRLNWASSVVDMSLDVESQLVFYTDKGNDHITVLSLNTGFFKTILHDKSSNPRSIVCDSINRVIYWTNWGKKQRIERVNYDGSNRTVVVNTELQWPEDLTLDKNGKTLYWTNTGLERIEVLDLISGNRNTVIRTLERYPSKMILFMDYILYTELGVAETLLMRVNTDGTGNVWLDGLPEFKYISDINVYRVNYHKQGRNKCATNNGGCSHICFPKSEGRTCACNNKYKLLSNGVSCSKKPWNWYWDMWMHTR